MNEITVKLSPEQFATIQKLLEPYVLLSAGLNAQYRAQSNLQNKTNQIKGDVKDE